MFYFAGHAVSNARTQLAWEHKSRHRNSQLIPNEYGCVPTKLYLKQQVLGQIWPASPSLWAIVLAHWSPQFVSPFPVSVCSSQPYSQVPGIMFLMRTLFPSHFAIWKMYRSHSICFNVINQTLGQFLLSTCPVLRGCVIWVFTPCF